MTEDLKAPAVLTVIVSNDNQKLSINKEKKKRKPSSFNIFKVALFMMRKSNKHLKNKQIQQSSENEELLSKGENWTKVVGSIRPLHIEDNQTPKMSPSTTVENFEDLVPQGSSYFFPSPSTCESSSTGTMSQYASACNLQGLNEHNSNNENNNSEKVVDAIHGDEMIDEKAEIFIAQFYQQLRLYKGL